MVNVQKRVPRASRNLMAAILLVCLALVGVMGALRLLSKKESAREERPRSEHQLAYERIETGMSERDVDNLLGCSRGWHRSSPPTLGQAIGATGQDGDHSSGWLFDDCDIWVYFTTEGAVYSKEIKVFFRTDTNNPTLR